MKFKTVIEVEAFGDGNLYTECIMVTTEKLNLDELLKEFYILEGIESNTGLDIRIMRETTENFISILELKGFNKLKTKKIYFCD